MQALEYRAKTNGDDATLIARDQKNKTKRVAQLAESAAQLMEQAEYAKENPSC